MEREYYEDQRTAYAMEAQYEHNHRRSEEDTYYVETCPYCHGRGWERGGFPGDGDIRLYNCPDCGGSGYIRRCKECNNTFDGEYCEDCFAQCETCGEVVPLDNANWHKAGQCWECDSCREEYGKDEEYEEKAEKTA